VTQSLVIYYANEFQWSGTFWSGSRNVTDFVRSHNDAPGTFNERLTKNRMTVSTYYQARCGCLQAQILLSFVVIFFLCSICSLLTNSVCVYISNLYIFLRPLSCRKVGAERWSRGSLCHSIPMHSQGNLSVSAFSETSVFLPLQRLFKWLFFAL